MSGVQNAGKRWLWTGGTDTFAVTDDDTGNVIVNPKLLNVSHVLSKFLSTQAGSVQPSPSNRPATKKQ
jgi:hypothetical protein